MSLRPIHHGTLVECDHGDTNLPYEKTCDGNNDLAVTGLQSDPRKSARRLGWTHGFWNPYIAWIDLCPTCSALVNAHSEAIEELGPWPWTKEAVMGDGRAEEWWKAGFEIERNKQKETQC